MTSTALHLPRTARRVDPLLAALAVAAAAGVLALWIAIAAAAPASRPEAAPREAVVVFAAGRPHAALERARAAAGPGTAVRVPRTDVEAAVDLRYLAASGSDRVVVVGPGAAAAVRDVAPAYPGTRFVVR
jgi:basic membrane lipoprotein Med (substrate-binding protein (PBP1-ABC) superfamily)